MQRSLIRKTRSGARNRLINAKLYYRKTQQHNRLEIRKRLEETLKMILLWPREIDIKTYAQLGHPLEAFAGIEAYKLNLFSCVRCVGDRAKHIVRSIRPQAYTTRSSVICIPPNKLHCGRLLLMCVCAWSHCLKFTTWCLHFKNRSRLLHNPEHVLFHSGARKRAVSGGRFERGRLKAAKLGLF